MKILIILSFCATAALVSSQQLAKIISYFFVLLEVNVLFLFSDVSKISISSPWIHAMYAQEMRKKDISVIT